MRRISISELSTMRWSFYQDVIRFSSLGLSSIGIWRQKIEEFGEAESLELLHEYQLNVSSLHWAGAFTGCDGKTHVEAIEDAIDAIQLARRLNADCLIVHSGSRNGHTHSHANRLFVSALDAIVPVAKDFGVPLAIEPMNGREGSKFTILNSFYDSLDLINRYPTDVVGLVLDLYHFGLSAAAFENSHQFADRLALVQLSDRDSNDQKHESRRPLGSGSVPINKWLRRLQRFGYSGAFEVELHGPGMENCDYFAMLDSTLDYLQAESIQALLSITPKPKQLQSAPINRRIRES